MKENIGFTIMFIGVLIIELLYNLAVGVGALLIVLGLYLIIEHKFDNLNSYKDNNDNNDNKEE